ncbi:MAG: N-acetylmuramic acid 6-phosphate etherase [Streptosporangiaceae bacterium]
MTTDPDAALLTEQSRAEFSDLDRMPVTELISVILGEARRAGESVTSAAGAIVPVVDGVTARLSRGGRLIYVGAGTAGRIGLLDAAEARPTFGVSDGTITAVLAGGAAAFASAAESAEDDPAAGAAAMDGHQVTSRDAVLGISASGRTPFVLGSIRRARELGALTVGLACNEDTPLGALADLPIEIAVGPEVIAGSTRLNAGTVQKIVLNTISTAVMIRLGKTFGGLMVDMRATNSKLKDRAIRIVTAISGAPAKQARAALEACAWHPKLASVVAARGLTPAEASALLDAHRGNLREALGALTAPP